MIEFVENMGLKIINGMELSEGTFTRVEGERFSIVDYGLADQDELHRVKRFFVDEKHVLAEGSDHGLINKKD